MKLRTLIFSIAFFSLLLSCTLVNGEPSGHLRKAEEFSRQGRIDEAISEYRTHMNERLSEKNRPEWENPYFYLLLIGDLEIRNGRVDDALKTYEEAEDKGVDKTLVSDRYRYVGSYLAERGDYQKAIEVLTRYRDRDPLLIDSMLDRLARKLVASQDSTK